MIARTALSAPTPSRRDVLRTGAGIAACVTLIVVLVACYGYGSGATPLAPGDLACVAALNALPVVALGALLLALTRRLLLSSWLALLPLTALYAANAAKVAQLQTPLLPADFRILGNLAPVVRLFSQYLHVGVPVLALVAALAGVTVLLVRERRVLRMTPALRIGIGACALLTAATLFSGASPWRKLFDAERFGFTPWSLSQSVGRAGLVGSLLLYHWEVGSGDVPPADEAAAIALLQEHAPAIQARLAAMGVANDLPDIVVVQSESLFDPARLNDVATGRWLRELYRLREHATGGDLSVPTFGGGTIRTEFEVLTGAPLASLGGVQYPWVEIDRARMPGLAATLARHGYRTTAIHPNSAAFWNRGHAYPALGFDRFVDESAFAPERIVGLFESDAALTDRILAELADDGAPQFVFAISMEAHGPFDWRPGLDAQRLAALPVPERLDDGGKYWFRNYLYLIDDADRELGRLADALAKRERRTLLLFYGDHLPALPPVYFQLGFEDGRAPEAQPVPWLLIDPASPYPRHVDTHSWMLPVRLLAAAGIDDDPYFAVLDALDDDLDGADPLDDDARAGVDALARLHLRGELPAVIEDALGVSLSASD
ncbi:MAG: LTA synthase family protein [Rudaea sp.]|uniref:LTA synthase family protein n=1 Tax=Rudaea sp. TaxID=2136325 RepID=UPI0039E643C7